MSDRNTNTNFLGRGWCFPPTFNLLSGEIEMVRDVEDIEQSLMILLGTVPGERVMNPSYGCGLKTLVFDSINATVIAQIKDIISRAILFFETRVILHQVDVDGSDSINGLLRITLDYTIITTNTRSNLVYPFYFLEATNVEV